MDSIQTQTLSIQGDKGGEAYIDFCNGQLCVSVGHEYMVVTQTVSLRSLRKD